MREIIKNYSGISLRVEGEKQKFTLSLEVLEKHLIEAKSKNSTHLVISPSAVFFCVADKLILKELIFEFFENRLENDYEYQKRTVQIINEHKQQIEYYKTLLEREEDKLKHLTK